MLDALEVYEPSLVNEDRTQATTSGQPRRRLAPASEGKAAPCCPETVPSPKPNGPALSKCAWRPASSVVVPREKHRATAPEWVPVAARPRRHRTGRRAWTPCIQVLVLLHRTKYHRHVSHQRHILPVKYNRCRWSSTQSPPKKGSRRVLPKLGRCLAIAARCCRSLDPAVVEPLLSWPPEGGLAPRPTEVGTPPCDCFDSMHSGTLL